MSGLLVWIEEEVFARVKEPFSMGKRRQYVKTTKCDHRLPTIEETEELGVAWKPSVATSQLRPWSPNVVSRSPEVDLEDCSGWGFDSFKTKLARLKELRQTLEPHAKQLEEKIKQSYGEVTDFVCSKSKQVSAVQIVWPHLQFRSAVDPK